MTIDNKVMLTMKMQLFEFLGDTSQLVYKRIKPFPTDVKNVDNLIVPTTFELVPRINDDVLQRVVYLEGNMAQTWNNFAINDLQIPSDLTKYVEFTNEFLYNLGNSYKMYTTKLVMMNPDHEKFWLSQYIDTYIYCDKNGVDKVRPTLRIQSDEWSTYYWQHLEPDMFLQDEFYIYISHINPYNNPY